LNRTVTVIITISTSSCSIIRSFHAVGVDPRRFCRPGITIPIGQVQGKRKSRFYLPRRHSKLGRLCRRPRVKWCSRPATIERCWRRFSNEKQRECWHEFQGSLLFFFPFSWLRRWCGGGNKTPCRAPLTDFVHFTGRSESWLLSRLPDDYYSWRNNKNSNNSSGRSTKTTAAGYWYRELDRLNHELRLGLDMDEFSNGREKGRLPFSGLFPLHVSAAKAYHSSVFDDATAAATATAVAAS
jgi:hypothetical protein